LSGRAAGPAVQVVALTKRYGHTWALRGVDISIAAGEAVALLGPNGSGKSTLLRILATAVRPSSGEVRIFGVSGRDGDALRRRVGLLSDRPPLYDELTALENLEFAATMYGLRVSERQLRAALDDVGLARAMTAKVRTFSQGMAQRLSIARARLQDPDLVLLDEPYNALDVEGLRLVDQLLANAKTQGKTAILATHHIAKGLAHCSRVLTLTGGRVTFDGSAGSFAGSQAALDAGAWE